MRPTPVCRHCNQRHFNFMSCEDYERKSRIERFNRPREGARDFGDRTHTMTTHGQNVVFLPRKNHPLYSPPEPPRAA